MNAQVNRVILVMDPLAGPDKWETHVVESHAAFLASKFDRRPPGMALYHGFVSPDTNVTPRDEEGVRRFLVLKGDVYAINYPGTGVEVALAIGLLIVAAVVLTAQNIPEVPISSARNSSPASANNDLAQRTNKPRPNARIPDIFGQVISVPDLLARTYSVYADNQEYEYAYMCIGRGRYLVEEIKDDTTLISQIDSAGVRVFGPNTSPNSGVPQIEIGATITEPVLSVARTEAVNGQVLVPPNEDTFTTNVRILYPNKLLAPPGSGLDFTELYSPGDMVTVTGSFFGPSYNLGVLNPTDPTFDFTASGTVATIQFYSGGGEGGPELHSAVGIFIQIMMADQTVGLETINLSGVYNVSADTTAGTFTLRDVDLFNTDWSLLPGGTTTLNATISIASGFTAVPLNGTYEVDTVDEGEIVFLDAGLVNGNWAFAYNGGATVPAYPPASSTQLTLSLNATEPNWIGPFDIELPFMTGFIVNLIAINGMYKDDGVTQIAADVTVEIEYTPISSTGNPLGPATVYRRTLHGSAVEQSQRALTIRPNAPFASNSKGRFRARRTTPKDITFAGRVVDEVQWKDLYATAPVDKLHFGDVTTIQTVTQSTASALSLKDRKLNAKVTRIIPILELQDDPPGYLFNTPAPSRDVADIVAAVCLDPKIGNRSASEIDFVNLRTTSDEIAVYFNRQSPRKFSYTFDDDSISFEETVKSIANACFCEAVRRGNIIQLEFEKLNPNSSLIFNHRNKLPGSEKRTINFGIDGGYDGVEFEYVDAADGSPQIIFLPEDRSATKPKTIRSIGVRSQIQAELLARRAWNKMQYQKVLIEFVGTQEAALVAKNERVLVANNVRTQTQDGEVRGKTGLVITTSQPVAFEDGEDYTVFLQAADQTVQGIAATPGVNEYEITLATEPVVSLSLDPANYAVATYVLVKGTTDAGMACLIAERSYDGPMSSRVVAVNYDARYYQDDQKYAGRIARYSESLELFLYDDATEEERDLQAFFAEDNELIPTANDPAYRYAEDSSDGEF